MSALPNLRSKLTYVVDVDNTILNTPGSDYINARPITDRISRINHLFDQGHTVIYWTARGGASGLDWTTFTVEQLAKFGCKYSKLWMNKPSYDVWIDDKALNDMDFFE